MIEAVITRNSGGQVVGITVSGHSGYAESGSDIVCAAVSAVVQTAILGLKNVRGLDVRDRTGDGELEFRIGRATGLEALCRADAITSTMVLGLKDIEQSYGDYLKVRIRDITEVSLA
ncbi:MAG: ribosomal-processing cysteine protease Prp [Bacillota bacterium]|nr:ribosomal-processing cysteine protease Prp [Bacillota bacterium]